MNLKCIIGFHEWKFKGSEFDEGNTRKCKRCNKIQYVFNDVGFGPNPYYWRDIEKK